MEGVVSRLARMAEKGIRRYHSDHLRQLKERKGAVDAADAPKQG